MLWSCGNLACLHPKLLPVCLWDVIYLESLGKHIPQRDPRFISGASVDISLLCSQWFSLCHCSLAGSLPRLNKDLKKKILPLVAILHGLVVVKPFWAGAEQWIVFLISFFNLHFFKPLLQQMVELHVHTLFSLQLMVFSYFPAACPAHSWQDQKSLSSKVNWAGFEADRGFGRIRALTKRTNAKAAGGLSIANQSMFQDMELSRTCVSIRRNT